MQKYTEIPSSQTLRTSREMLLNNDKTAISCSSGTSFPTENVELGMLCYRTDEKKLYEFTGAGTWSLLLTIGATGTVVNSALKDANGNSFVDKYLNKDNAKEWIEKQGIIGGNDTKNATRILTSGIYTVPDGVTTIYVSGCGGGGGGSAVYGGGGGESIYRKQLTVTAGEQINVTIGTGGKCANNAYGSFSAPSPSSSRGGTTSFGSYISLAGGYGASYSGSQNYLTQVPIRGGDGGTNGERCSMTWSTSEGVLVWVGGRGGDSLFGKGGTGGSFDRNDSNSVYTNANDGIGYGAGGGGCGLYGGTASLKQTGSGNGSSGIIIVEYS